MTLPDPLVPAEVDCTDLDGFMLNVERLMASELVALSSHEVIGAALLLWCRAWKQTPAASLPNNEKTISGFARMPLARFRKLRDEVMRGFVLCSDGRLYHRTLAVEAINAYERKVAFQRKREADAERLRKWRSGTKHETRIETASETSDETRFVAEGQGQGQGQGHSSLPSVESVARATPPPADGSGPTLAGTACRLLREAGVQRVNPSDPRLAQLLAQGVTPQQLAHLAAEIREAQGVPKPMAYVLAAMEGRLRDAATAPVMPPGTAQRVGAPAPGSAAGFGAEMDRLSAAIDRARGAGPEIVDVEARRVR